MAGGVRDGRKLKGVIPGGSSMPVLPAEIMMRTDMDYDSIAKAGLDARLGRGDRDGRLDLHGARARAPVVLLLRGVLRPVHALPRGHRLALPRGEPDRERPRSHGGPATSLNNVSDNIAGRTICALGDAAALPVKSFIKHYRDEFVFHIHNKSCVPGAVEPRWGRSGVHVKTLQEAA